jgi:protein gp37
MNKTDIDYLNFTWNPVVMRCTPVSEGCDHCWHLRMVNRLSKNPKIGETERVIYTGQGMPLNGYFPYKGTEVKAPCRKKKPSIIGVQFMGDLFHENVHKDTIHGVWDIMKSSPQHTFIILTKRPERMKEVLSMIYSKERMGWSMGFWQHVWLGVTCENQARADERIPILLQIPAAKRFVSIEPMLGPVDLTNIQAGNHWINALNGNSQYVSSLGPRLDWVILGGETGPGARPMHPGWVRSVRDQCQAAGVPFFFKSFGEYEMDSIVKVWNPDGEDKPFFHKVGKKRTGHILDGREWREFPA